MKLQVIPAGSAAVFRLGRPEVLSVTGAKRQYRRCHFLGGGNDVDDDAGKVKETPGVALWQLMVTLTLGRHKEAPDRALRAS